MGFDRSQNGSFAVVEFTHGLAGRPPGGDDAAAALAAAAATLGTIARAAVDSSSSIVQYGPRDARGDPPAAA
eukprot:COSAG01_NODE_8634_length_2713_cov_1.980107_6_plen_71_part_01